MLNAKFRVKLSASERGISSLSTRKIKMSNLIASKLKWVVANKPESTAIAKLIEEIENLHPVVAQLLIQRGLNTFDIVRDFFKSDLNDINSFGELKNCERGAERLFEAIKKGEKILIYGDYDVDGSTSVSMMTLFLQSVGANVSYYIPDRYAEGYGVSSQGIDFALSGKYDLMITVDCGINAVHQLERATENGVDVIICDHHIPGRELPQVFAILNPQQSDCTFTGKELCGCGVALMLLRSLSRKLNKPDEWKKYLDLAAIATCCDIVPLTGINRLIVSAGIGLINQHRSPGIVALLKTAGYEGDLNVGDIVFKIGPRINAAGRLDHANLAVKLLIEKDLERAMEFAAEIESLNLQRRKLDVEITESALAQMNDSDPGLERKATVVHSRDWHKGVIGIVASRLIERCYRPTIVLTEVEGMLTGSARSIEGIHLYEALASCREHLEKFGGHSAAAGLTLKAESLDAFMDAFEKAIAIHVPGERKSPELNIDCELDFSEWYNHKFTGFFTQLNRCRPYGPFNMPPIFATRRCKARFPKIVGKEHLKFEVYQEHDQDRKIPVIAFRMADLFDDLASGKSFQLAYNIEEQVWKGRKSIQLVAKDIIVG